MSQARAAGSASGPDDIRSEDTPADAEDVRRDTPTTGVADTPPSDDASRHSRWISAALMLVLAAMSIVLSWSKAMGEPGLSALDEAAHIDTVWQLPHVVQTGEFMLPQTLDEIACRGVVQIPNIVMPACGAPQPSPPYENFVIGAGGYNTADIHPPTYYVIVRLGLAIGEAVSDAEPVTIMRMTGGVFLALGACLIFLLSRKLGANQAAAFGMTAVLISAPLVLTMSSIVNVDAIVLPTGAAFALLALWAWERRSIWWLLPLGAAIVMLIKLTNLTALMVVGLFLILWQGSHRLSSESAARGTERLGLWWAAHGAGLRRAVGVVVLVCVAGAAATLGWYAIRDARALIPGSSLPIAALFAVDQLLPGNVLVVTFTFASPQAFAPFWMTIDPQWYPGIRLAALMIIVLLTVLAWFRDRMVWAALTASLVVLIAAPSVYILLNYYSSGQYFDPGARYGFAMLPVLTAAVAAGLRGRVAGGVGATAGVVALVGAVVAL